MVLRITNDQADDFPFEDKVMEIKDFADTATHPFIAAGKWSRVYIDIDDEVPTGIIRQVVKVYTVKPVIKNIEDISTKGMLLLCEIFPDHSAKLRYLYMKQRGEFTNLVKELVHV